MPTSPAVSSDALTMRLYSSVVAPKMSCSYAPTVTSIVIHPPRSGRTATLTTSTTSWLGEKTVSCCRPTTASSVARASRSRSPAAATYGISRAE